MNTMSLSEAPTNVLVARIPSVVIAAIVVYLIPRANIVLDFDSSPFGTQPRLLFVDRLSYMGYIYRHEYVAYIYTLGACNSRCQPRPQRCNYWPSTLA